MLDDERLVISATDGLIMTPLARLFGVGVGIMPINIADNPIGLRGCNSRTTKEVDCSVKYTRCFRYRDNVVCLLHYISPLSLAVAVWFQFVAVFSRTNNVELSKRILAPKQDFVHAVIRIGLLDFMETR